MGGGKIVISFEKKLLLNKISIPEFYVFLTCSFGNGGFIRDDH